jgi:phage anti-repressor protein
MEKTSIDIKTLIKTSDIHVYDNTKLIDKLKEHFSEEEQRLYVSNLFLYLNYHPVDDFVVDLDNVWKFIGFSNKGNGKRLLKQHFTENRDYKIALLRSEKRKNEGGYNEETIMLNINTFKKLCLKSNTENADKIHDYYIKLEIVYNELMKEQLREQKTLVEEQKTMIKEKEKLLLEQNKEINKYKEKIYEEVEKRGFVYVIKTDSYNFYKVGKTKDFVLNRVKGLQTGNVNDIQILLEFQTSNPDLLEKNVHYILDRYRCNSGREFFECNFEYIQKIIEICGNTIDTLKSTYQNIFNSQSINSIDKEIFINIDKFSTLQNTPSRDQDQQLLKDNQFYQWLDKNVILQKGSVLRLKNVVSLYTGRKLHPKAASILRLELEMYIKNKYTSIKSEYSDSSFNGERYKGWLNLILCNENK